MEQTNLFTTEYPLACCFTGHRDLGGANVADVRFWLDAVIAKLCEKGCTTFYSGGAYGFDLIAAERVIALAERGVCAPKLIFALPFPGHDARWPDGSRELLRDLQAHAETVYVGEHYRTSIYAERNRYMVERSRYCVAFFDERQPRSGTAQTVRLAERKGLTVLKYLLLE